MCLDGYDAAHREHESLKAAIFWEKSGTVALSKDTVTVTGVKSHRINLSVDNQEVVWELTMCVFTEMKNAESGTFQAQQSTFFGCGDAVGNPEVIKFTPTL